MVNFLDVLERATSGPMMTQKDFDIKVFIPSLKNVLKKYDIVWDRRESINSDDNLSGRIFEAAVDFYSEVGTYLIDTERVIRFTKAEIFQAVEDAPKEVYFGEGPDRCVIKGRLPDSNELAHCHTGSSVDITGDMGIKLAEAYARITKAKTISIPTVINLGHIRAQAGSPAEILTGIRAVQNAREGCRRAGRPGLAFLNMVPACSNGATTIAATAPQFGGRPTDGWLVASLAELKMDYSSLNKVAYLTAWGANIGQEQGPVLGGYCGGPEGLAVVNTAYAFHGILVSRATYHLSFPVHINYVCSSVPEVIWPISASVQAIERNIRVPYITLLYTAAGAATRMYFEEAMACLFMIIASGSAVHDPHPGKGKATNSFTPVEMEFSIQLAHACKGLTRKEANKMLNIIIPKYIKRIPNPPKGETLEECYDIERFEPKPHFKKLYYDEIVTELKKEFGIELYKY